jgi:hypothetical protein
MFMQAMATALLAMLGFSEPDQPDARAAGGVPGRAAPAAPTAFYPPVALVTDEAPRDAARRRGGPLQRCVPLLARWRSLAFALPRHAAGYAVCEC